MALGLFHPYKWSYMPVLITGTPPPRKRTFGAVAQVVETVDVGSNSGAEQEVSRFGGRQTWHVFKKVSFRTSQQETVGT